MHPNMYTSGLRPGAVILHSYITDNADADGGLVSTQQDLAEGIGATRKTVGQYVRELADAGALVIDVTRQPHRYTPRIPGVALAKPKDMGS